MRKAICRSCKNNKSDWYPISAMFDHEYHLCKVDKTETNQAHRPNRKFKFPLNKNEDCPRFEARILIPMTQTTIRSLATLGFGWLTISVARALYLEAIDSVPKIMAILGTGIMTGLFVFVFGVALFYILFGYIPGTK